MIFTALPQGLQGTTPGRALRLLAFISPRLYTDEGLPLPELGQFPDFVDWPSTRVSWAVQFDDLAPVRATVTSGPALPGAWTAVFSPKSYVEPYRYQSFTGRITRSYPHASVRQFVLDLYANVAAASPVTFPSRQALFAPPGGPPGHLNPIAFGRTGKVATGHLGADTEEQALGAVDAFLDGNLVARTADLDAMAAASGVTGPAGIAMLQVKRFAGLGRRDRRAESTATWRPCLPRHAQAQCLPPAGCGPTSWTSTR